MAKYLEPKRVSELWDKGVRATRKQIQDYNLNSLFCAGEQWVWANTYTGGVDEIPRLDPERVRFTADVLWPRTSGLIAAATARPLLFHTPPSSADDAAVIGAQVCDEVMADYADRQDWETIREDQAWTTLLGGTAALCLDWDPTAGDAIRDPSTNTPLSTADGARSLYTGDITASCLALPEFTCQPGTRIAERGLYWIKLVALPPEEAKALYNLSETPKADTVSVLSPAQWRLQTNNGSTLNQQLTGVYTYYERPSRNSPGQIIVVIGNERVDEGDWPFPFTDRLNLAVSRETPRHARWYGDTVLTTSRIVQMGVNQAWSSLIEHTKKHGNSRQWVNEATYRRMGELTDEPGELAVYVGPEKPFRSDPAQLPGWLVQQPDRLVALIDEQLSTVEVGRGVAPRNVESGLGLSILSEKAGTRIERLVRETARSWSTFATMVAQTLEANVTETREGQFPAMPEFALPARTFEWTGQSFAGQTKVEVPLDAILPRSQAQIQAWAQNALDRNGITLRQYARIIQMPEADSLIAIADPDINRAENENWKMAQGRVCIPAAFDNDEKHIEVIESHMKTERFERYAPEIREVFVKHWLAHRQQMMDKAAQAMAGLDAMGMDPTQPTPATAPPQPSPTTPPPMPSTATPMTPPDLQFDAGSLPPSPADPDAAPSPVSTQQPATPEVPFQ